MRIVVAGASGYIGSVLTKGLWGNGDQIIAADFKLTRSLQDACRHPGVDIVQADCRSPSEVHHLIKDADIIYWLVGATAGSHDHIRATNVEAAKNLASCIGQGQTIVYAQTNAGYRPGESGIVTEETPMIGESVYAKTKIEAEKILMDTGRCVSFRLAAVYGPAPTIRWETLLNNMVYHAVKRPTVPFELYQSWVVRDVLFMNDLIQRLHLPLYGDFAGEVYNLSGQSQLKIGFLDHVFTHRAFAGQPPRTYVLREHSDPDQRNFKVSEEKFAAAYLRIFGCSPETTTLEDGIAMTIRAARLEP